jgi:hypothetical protein
MLQGSTRPLVVKFADSKKQLKLKEEGGGISLSDAGSQAENGQSQLGSAKMPDFWSKQFQLQQQQQQQQMMYSYSVPNGTMQQQQQLLPVPIPYGSHGNSQQPQPYLYMQQQNTAIAGGYPYDLNSPGHNGDGGDAVHHQQSRYPSQQPYNRQQQQYQPNSAPRDSSARQRNAWPSTGGRADKQRYADGSPLSGQEQDDLYAPLDSNGEISSRYQPSSQRPTEGLFFSLFLCLSHIHVFDSQHSQSFGSLPCRKRFIG